MNRQATLAGIGLAVTVLAAGAGAQIVVDHPPARAAWPDELSAAFREIDTGSIFEAGIVDALVLAGDQLVVVKRVGSAPACSLVATGVQDFAVLPPDAAGLSGFLAVDGDGLWVGGAVAGPDPEDPPVALLEVQLAAGSWAGATCLSTVADPAGGYAVSAIDSSGTTVVRGRYVPPSSWTPGVPITSEDPPLSAVALEFDAAVGGIEVACAGAGGLQVYSDDGTPLLAQPYPTLEGFVRLDRIPGGADGADSLSYMIDILYGDGSLGPVLFEIDHDSISLPIYAAPREIVDMDFARLGADQRTDLVAVSPLTSEIVTLHGTDHATANIPFTFLAGEFFQVPLTAQLFDEGNVPISPRAAAADVDGDGDGDLVVVSDTTLGPKLFLVRGGGGVAHPATPVFDSEGVIRRGESLTETIQFLVGVTLTKPSGWTHDPNWLRVRVYTRDGLENGILPTPWHVEDFAVSSPQLGTTIDFVGTIATEADNELFYLELQPLYIDTQVPANSKRGSLTVWVGATDNAILDLLFCAEPDEFSPETCEDDPVLVTAINRRTVLTPIQIGGGN